MGAIKDKKELLQAFSGKRVAIVGDVMLDRYIIGRVNRISPEAPVPVMIHDSTVARLGGAANVALNIKQLGSQPYICSVIGEDNAAKELVELIKNLGDVDHVLPRIKNRKTTVKTRLLGNNQHLLRLDSESNTMLSDAEADLLLNGIRELISIHEIDIVILQDYNKGVLTPYVIEQVLSLCQEHNVFVAVDPKFDNFFSYQNVDLFKPNLKEICQALGTKVSSDIDDLNHAATILAHRLQPKHCMITLSEKGIYLNSPDGEAIVVPTEVDEIVDVCGAGDAVLAVSALMLSTGLGVERTGVVANKAGKIVCQKLGVAPITIDELIKDA